ncbi:MAG: hypothetical protein J1F02_09250 [Lachnospiraceae bacterium]|nr:hypothetical protein [Lachnospiraceae bacterium]
MEDVKLFLYLTDVEYGKRLLRFLSGKRNPRLHPELVTTKAGIFSGLEKDSREMAVLTDCRNVQESGEGKVIYLSDKPGRRDGEIFQYQKAEEIYRELLNQLDMPAEPAGVQKENENADKGVYFVFAPGGSGGAMLAAMLAQYLGRQGQCLYLSLAGFPLYYGEELRQNPDVHIRGIGELLFFMEQADFVEKERELRQNFGTAYMMGPMSHYKDLLDCSAEEWERFFQRLMKECGYDSIVVEMDQLYEFTLDMLEKGHRTLVLWGQGICGQIQRAVFAHYCQIEHREAAVQKMQSVELPWEYSEWEQEWAAQPLSELSENPQKMAFIKELLENRGEEEQENVCIIEDAG